MQQAKCSIQCCPLQQLPREVDTLSIIFWGNQGNLTTLSGHKINNLQLRGLFSLCIRAHPSACHLLMKTHCSLALPLHCIACSNAHRHL